MNEPMQWQAVIARDARRDGGFVYGVVTTGVYCRPSCPARKPRRENVRFFAGPAEAEAAGLRACKRCRPDAAARSAAAPWIAELCRYIEAHCDQPLTGAHLARRAGVSPARLRRAFRAAIGVTPRAYAEACRQRMLKRRLRDAPSTTAAIFDAGFGSTSRVYEPASQRMGMTPRQYRDGGAGTEISYAAFDTPLGLLMVAATDRGLCFVQFGETEATLAETLRAEYPRAALTRTPADRARPPFSDWIAALSDYLQGAPATLDLPTDVRATAFQRQVWDYLCRIPQGELRSYSDVARALDRPKAVRAVGRAIAANRVGLVIPCHRVIRGDGTLGGYRWGVERKRALIARERGEG